MLKTFKSLAARVDGEAWVRFFLALAGLALGFASAVFSSAASEAGSVVATAGFASLALLLAGIGGVLTGSSLALQDGAAPVRPQFHYQVTVHRRGALGPAVVVSVAAA